MSESEQRVRDACLAWDGTSLDDRDLPKCVRVGDLRATLADLDAAREDRDAAAVADCPRLCAEFCNEHKTYEALQQAEADLARVTAERDKWRRLACIQHDKLLPAVEDRRHITARLARAEGLLRLVRERGISAPTEEAMDTYFAASEQEPRNA